MNVITGQLSTLTHRDAQTHVTEFILPTISYLVATVSAMPHLVPPRNWERKIQAIKSS